MSAPLLDVRDVETFYGTSQALFGVSLTVHDGEFVTLIGRNGMGRSTLVKCLFGLLPMHAGSIAFRGSRTDRLPSHRIARHGLALVPEGRQVFPNLNVEENLVATARASGTSQTATPPWTLQRVYELFPRLKERRTNLGSALSGGEQQMLAIGRALMTNPSLLVLDEATEGLSPLVRADIWRVLAQLKRDGLSLIVIDKNVGALLKLADRHYVLEKGRIVWSGASEELRTSREIIHRYLGV
jgi:branched-chain amino acid transport system ATP-binding protein